MFFSKLKAHLRKAAHRDVEALWKEVGVIISSVSPSECTNYFSAAGYVYN
jgi:transposase